MNCLALDEFDLSNTVPKLISNERKTVAEEISREEKILEMRKIVQENT